MNRGSRGFPCSPFRRTSCFNEAPIHESGKCSCAVHDRNRRICASMRPRFMNRGSSAGLTTARCSTVSFNEAPIHESGKSRGRPQERRSISASMRPRFMNRGSVVLFERDPRAVGASMRPRFMNRGSDGSQARPGGHWRGFNEAPIHESGKSETKCKLAPSLGSFNEAPIHESGKCTPRAIAGRE